MEERFPGSIESSLTFCLCLLFLGRGHAVIQETIAQDPVLGQLRPVGLDHHAAGLGTPETIGRDPAIRIVAQGKMAMRTVIAMVVMTHVLQSASVRIGEVAPDPPQGTLVPALDLTKNLIYLMIIT